ncbi:MAG: cyclic beta 1-2 glucan synthetase, partial [Sphingobacteriales bacterium]
LLWLPFAVSRYIAATGDRAILDSNIGYLESRMLHPHEETLYDLHATSNLKGTLYEHCVKAIRHSLRFGKHGLPLIGGGDWNDGMDRVGDKGQGESIWLAFFLYDILISFSETAAGYGDDDFAAACREAATTLQGHIETSGWDGQWYIRAYFDNGTPLGSRENDECRIDAIAQSWAVLSGAADAKRAEMAMESLDKYLVNRELKIIQLLHPAFDSEGVNPGYIKGYVPGVRENGGQYSHAAIWALMAFATLGKREKVWELFSMVQPIGHGDTAAKMETYKAEPYVMAADVYANESHKGRGGWTWYTGSSGWMYQFITGSLLGLQLQDGSLSFKPCFPQEWPSITISYRFRTAVFILVVFQIMDGKESHWIMDGKVGKGHVIKLADDGQTHQVEIHVAG